MSYEGKMARNSLRKAIAYSNELLSMIAPTDELEPWVQAKINDMDHYIEAVYGYYKFGESMDEPVYNLSKMHDDVLYEWKNKEPVSYVKHLQKFFGPPEELTSRRAIWHDKDGFKRIEILDEFILHASPTPHYDYVYSYVDLKVSHDLSDDLAKSSESILIDHLKGEVGARCASLSANAVTIQYVIDVVGGKIAPSKLEYEARIEAMKKMFVDGETYVLDWWPDESKDTDPNNPYYKDSVDDSYIDLNSDGQVTVGDYTTKHFDICPSAQALYSSIKDKTVMIHLIVETMMLQDLLFRQEKQAIAQGSIDSDDLEKAEEFAELIMNNAKQMNLETEHAYIEDVHIAKFKQLAGVPSSEEDYDDEENGSSMDNETFTILLSPES
jgi:hypothetical protein